ncbi:MAG: hypothetical protein GC190_17965 [Alphaproteobacteria bacterium]|nr:hypothetical protein [Alphaproteobacteria bacterium]
MGSVLWWTGVVVGALALAALVVHGFGVAVGAPFDGVLDTYELVSQAVFGKFEPAIERWLATTQSEVGHDLLLYPHWKHVFLLLWLYFLADLRSAVEQRKFVVALVLFVWGTLVALIASIGSGTVPLDGSASASLHTVLLAFPVIAVTLHQVAWCLLESFVSRAPGESALVRFVMFLREEVLPIALGGVIAVALCFYSPSIPLLAQSSDPGVALLVASLVALAVFHLWRGGVYAALDRHADEGWWRAVGRTGSARLATFMLAMLAGAGLLFATNIVFMLGA